MLRGVSGGLGTGPLSLPSSECSDVCPFGASQDDVDIAAAEFLYQVVRGGLFRLGPRRVS